MSNSFHTLQSSVSLNIGKSKKDNIEAGGVHGQGCNDLAIAETQPYKHEAPPQDLFNSEDGDVDFRRVSRPAAAVLIAKFQIGLGALSIPSTFHALEFFPGIFCFLILSSISTMAGYLCGNARQYCPHMHNIGHAAELLFAKGS
ncbi:hypothetical protein ACHAPA_011667 [Fusarium lateritium]